MSKRSLETSSDRAREANRRRLWTTEEDSLLIEAVQGYSDGAELNSAWPLISNIVGNGRSSKDCRKRWYHTLDPQLKRGRWTLEEDAALRVAFQEHGAQWHKMAPYVPGRTAEQVAKRWRDVLAPDLVLSAPWTSEEDALLARRFNEHGPKWTLISDAFPSRNGIACRNRFRRLRAVDTSQTGLTAQNLDSEGLSASSASLSPGIPFPPSNTLPDTREFSFDLSSIPLPSYDEDLSQMNSQPTAQPGPEQGSDFLFDFGYPPFDEWDQFTQAVNSLPIMHQAESSNNHVNPEVWDDDSIGVLMGTANDSLPATDPFGPIDTQPRIATEASGVIDSPWALLGALESGRDPLTLSANLVRSLIADASRARAANSGADPFG